MAETEKTKTEDTGEEALSRKRRTALVSYLAILFAVAFLLVALSMVIENKRLQSTNAAIKNDSQKTSANLNKTITDMQTENDELTEQISALQQQLDELQTEADRQAAEAEDQISALTAERDGLQEEKTALEAEKTELSEALADAEQRAADAVEVSELLQKAIAANDEGKHKTLQYCLEKIEPLKDLLSPSELEWYESLIMD